MGYLNSQNAYESPESGLLEEEHVRRIPWYIFFMFVPSHLLLLEY